MTDQTIYNKCKLFFEARFNEQFKPETNDYHQEWLDRFESGHPENWMDLQSLRVYRKLINGELDV